MKKLLFTGAAIISVLNAGGYISPAAPIEPIAPVVPQQCATTVTSNFYLGGALSLVSARKANVDADFFSEKRGQDRLGNLTLLGGYNFNKFIALEGRVTTTISQKDFTKLTSYSLFAKPQYHINNNFSIYTLLGVGHIKLGKNRGSNVDVSKTSFQWGVGAKYNITDRWAVFADYTSLANDASGRILDYHKADVDSINVGVIYNF